MSNTFITSDFHFGHDQDFIWGDRGFRSIQEHDEAIIRNWNEIVSAQDEVYVLGDLMLNDQSYGIRCLQRLNGSIHVILGNHDTNQKTRLYCEAGLDIIGYAHQLRVGREKVFLCHYPALVANYRDRRDERVTCFCGHSHTRDPFEDADLGCYHVELDAHEMKPVLIEDALADYLSRLE